MACAAKTTRSSDIKFAINAAQLIDSGIATGGMRAKLESAVEALRSGIHEVVIAPGAAPGILS